VGLVHQVSDLVHHSGAAFSKFPPFFSDVFKDPGFNPGTLDVSPKSYYTGMVTRQSTEGSALPKKKAGAAGMNDTITAFARLADQARSRIEEISAAELSRAKLLPVIIDVRESDEYAEGHIQTAKHLSRGVLEQKIDEFVPDFSTPVVVYCDRGDRAALVTENLLKMGYQNVRSLRGGLQSWLESGGELEVSDRFRQRKRV
jgi:phage shock protein E